ncbi:MAG: ceramidase domain-containing protein [Myxococcaceae bacterium]|nr:ceramidase domain-containing protein [Myxococcaceae bacterium]
MDLTPYPNLTNPECPWHAVREWGGLPNVKWCEETLCSWVAEPTNTWSNLAFLVTAAAIFVVTRRETSRTERFWPVAAFWVGVTSLVYHASVTFVLQVFDFFGMYFFFSLVLLLNLVRLELLSKERLFPVLWASIIGLTVFTVVVAKASLPVQGIVGVMLVAGIVTEAWATVKRKSQVRWFLGALAFIAVAGAFSASDVSRRWCDPTDHVFQGHAIWHVLNAVGIGLAYVHYRQFKALFP